VSVALAHASRLSSTIRLFHLLRPGTLPHQSSTAAAAARLRLFTTSSIRAMPLPAPQLPESAAGSTAPAKLHLYTAGTPNGYKPSILLEELRLAYPDLKNGALSYDFTSLSFANKEQKDPEYLKINPNGRIPALVDDNAGGHNVFESASILIWLVEVSGAAPRPTYTPRRALRRTPTPTPARHLHLPDTYACTYTYPQDHLQHLPAYSTPRPRTLS
jgi:hypothetical protein